MNLPAAVDAMCKACIFDRDADGTWRQQVAACTARTCPLYQVRPAVDRRSGVQNAAKLPASQTETAGAAL
jgi:hypothetical protein